MRRWWLWMIIGGLLLSLRGAQPARLWQSYVYRGEAYERGALAPAIAAAGAPDCPGQPWPREWEIHSAVFRDVTGDGAPECVLLVWRPWQDWPIMEWSQWRSPIAANRDAAGYSAHVILTRAEAGGGYRELWAGSALAVPLLRLAVGDVDGDGLPELVALEGDYVSGRAGPARYLAVWRWNGFGFTLDWRSPPGVYTALALYDGDGDGRPEIWTR